MNQPVCVVVGAGLGNGASFAHKFEKEGFNVALIARDKSNLDKVLTTLRHARGYVCDASDEQQVQEAFDTIRNELGVVHTLIYNAGSRDFHNIEATDAIMFEQAWKTNTLGCFLTAKQVIPDMKEAGAGNIIIIGATASLTGNAGFTAFASSKAAQRSLAQSMARQLGPAGIHVSYVIIDAIVDSPISRNMFPNIDGEGLIQPDDVADTVFYLSRQERSAWTFELDLRPYCEQW